MVSRSHLTDERNTHLVTKPRIVLVNMRGTELDSLADLLEMWNFTVLRIDEAKTLSVLLDDATPLIVIFQFREFSESEYELLASIRKTAPDLPILALSSFISVRDTFRIAKSGASEYLVQPYSPEDLKRMIAKYLEIASAERIGNREARTLKSQ